MVKETVSDFLARGGKVTNCKSGKAKGSNLGFSHPSSVFSRGRKYNTLQDANFYLSNCKL